MTGILRGSDPWSSAVIILTLVLFLLALFLKGFTHDLLLEAGVFLVSVKLILMAHKGRIVSERADSQLRQIEGLLRNLQDRLNTPEAATDVHSQRRVPRLTEPADLGPTGRL